MAIKTINEEEAKKVEAFIYDLIDQNKERDEKIKELKKKNNLLQDSVEEFTENSKQMEELKSESRDTKKFLEALISFAEKSSGKDFVDNGPLYREAATLEE